MCVGEGMGSILSPLRNLSPPRAIKVLCAGVQREEGSHWPSDEDLGGWRVCGGGCQWQSR